MQCLVKAEVRSKAGFPLGEFVRANRERSNLIGWRQTLTTSPANHIRFLLETCSEFPHLMYCTFCQLAFTQRRVILHRHKMSTKEHNVLHLNYKRAYTSTSYLSSTILSFHQSITVIHIMLLQLATDFAPTIFCEVPVTNLTRAIPVNLSSTSLWSEVCPNAHSNDNASRGLSFLEITRSRY